MSNTPFDRNPDLRKLRDEGFDLALSSANNHLVVRGVPYVNMSKEVKKGDLVVALSWGGDVLAAPPDHVAYFVGGQPCEMDGRVIAGIVNDSKPPEIDKDIRPDRTFSGKPATPFKDYYEKVAAYVHILEEPARAIDPSVTARTFPPYEMKFNESVFRYADTASSRAKITGLSSRLEAGKIAIVGLGGTGSYVLDFLVKAPIKEIHVFDGDAFLSHNAFRSPGAASLETLRERPTKVAYHKRLYENLRHQIFEHEYPITAANVGELDSMEFVFLCMDGGAVKKEVVNHLLAKGIGFIDVGMGLDSDSGSIGGVVITTTVTPSKSDHIPTRISFVEPAEDDEYDSNIQVAELNALNAAHAVIKWKKLRGFYSAAQQEHFTVYTVSQNSLINDDLA